MDTPQYTSKDITRFWSKVNKNGSIPAHRPGLGACWEWNARLFWHGYGCFTQADKKLYAHRVSWQLSNGEIPVGLFVLHECDNRACVNPTHLFLGTALDNAKDRDKKGRYKHGNQEGEKNGRHKLTVQQVIEIRERYAAGGITYKKLATEMGVSITMIADIVKRNFWKSV